MKTRLCNDEIANMSTMRNTNDSLRIEKMLNRDC